MHLAQELVYERDDLSNARGRNGMSFRFKATGSVDRNFPTHGGLAIFCRAERFTPWEEIQIIKSKNFGTGKTIMNLRNFNTFPDSGRFISDSGALLARMLTLVRHFAAYLPWSGH
jgi:hypothetical protein